MLDNWRRSGVCLRHAARTGVAEVTEVWLGYATLSEERRRFVNYFSSTP
ncbi:hypothetical protein B6N60_03183 [Richelia sinica FACHB-800]|uniref:Uncharacterized protein n=1 Tax=Richelia sinica FACHB-800 TaxID=1357546 RepID=A0A975Y5Q7_9NOST|nr:hypothetical protein [Richelia sinica FACHB-800]QXE24478.1 hypothetical protein B6N60_03183 [Richelia sinica FACHB-800]